MAVSAQNQIELPPPVAMLTMIQGFWLSRAVYVAAKLGIPDLLKDGSKTSEELSQATGTHARSLYRLLRALASVDVLAEDDQGRFALTPVGATLRTDVPGSLRFFVMEELGGNHYAAWEKLLYSVQTGEIAFNHLYGMSKWQYNAQNPEEGRIFDDAMANFSSVVNKEIVAAYDFASSAVVVDVGGGDGSLSAAILNTHPRLRGVLIDLPHVVDGAQRRLHAEGLAGRCEVVAGDFLESLPSGDTYVLKWIVHDWDDAQSTAILRNCRSAMVKGGRVLVIDAIIPPGNGPSFSKFMDLNMLVMTGGRERNEAEYRALFDKAGLQLAKIYPTHTEMRVIEAVLA